MTPSLILSLFHPWRRPAIGMAEEKGTGFDRIGERGV
jgi:hypothetical protein